MEIYIIRHGETRLNKQNVLQGWTDEPLDEAGVELAAKTGRAMRGVRFDVCYVSPLVRARQTADELLRESGNASTPVIVDESAKEICCGEFEGKFYGKGSPVYEYCKVYFNDPMHFAGFPGGETVGALIDRTSVFIDRIIAEEGAKDGDGPAERRVLVSTHGCALRAMLNRFYSDPSDFWHGRVPPNCAVSMLKVKDGRAKLAVDDRVYATL